MPFAPVPSNAWEHEVLVGAAGDVALWVVGGRAEPAELLSCWVWSCRTRAEGSTSLLKPSLQPQAERGRRSLKCREIELPSSLAVPFVDPFPRMTKRKCRSRPVGSLLQFHPLSPRNWEQCYADTSTASAPVTGADECIIL